MPSVLEDFHSLQATLNAFGACLPQVESAARLIIERLHAGNTLYACGNGGSATDALHLTEELIGRYRGDRPSLPGICLCADVSALTCIGNDYGFDAIFARQVEGLCKPDDILVGFSTSGNSANIHRAFEAARKKGTHTILLTGRDGGMIKDIADHTIIVPSDNTARIQEMHTFILHAWLEQVEAEDWTR